MFRPLFPEGVPEVQSKSNPAILVYVHLYFVLLLIDKSFIICDTKIQITVKESEIENNVSTGHKGSKKLH